MTIDIGIVVAIIGCLVGLAGWMRNGKIDYAELISTLSKLSVKLDTTCNTLTRLESQMTNINSAVMDLNKEIVVLQTSYKDTLNRVNDHSARIKELERKLAALSKKNTE